MQLVSVMPIRWIVIYPVDSGAIQRLNNRGLVVSPSANSVSLSLKSPLKGEDNCLIYIYIFRFTFLS